MTMTMRRRATRAQRQAHTCQPPPTATTQTTKPNNKAVELKERPRVRTVHTNDAVAALEDAALLANLHRPEEAVVHVLRPALLGLQQKGV